MIASPSTGDVRIAAPSRAARPSSIACGLLKFACDGKDVDHVAHLRAAVELLVAELLDELVAVDRARLA